MDLVPICHGRPPTRGAACTDQYLEAWTAAQAFNAKNGRWPNSRDEDCSAGYKLISAMRSINKGRSSRYAVSPKMMGEARKLGLFQHKRARRTR